MKYEKVKLGSLIRQVDLRNKNLKIHYLLGVSNEKKLIKSIANINGTDLSTYKVLKKNQFVYVPTTSRNGDKISIALMEEKECIVSSSYTVFEIIDRNKLLPEYLILIFKAPEFDRYTRFMSFGTAREVFDWNTMCDTYVSIPSIEEQKDIVDNFNIISRALKTNNKKLNNLKILLKNLFKNWLVDFEFPNELGEPYKSSGGKMIESKYGMIPFNWDIYKLSVFFPVITGKKDANIGNKKGEYNFFTCSKQNLKCNDFSFEGEAILLSGNGDFNVKYYNGKFEAYQRTYVLMPYEKNKVGVLYQAIKYYLKNITSGERGSVIKFITKGSIEDFELILPKNNLYIFEKIYKLTKIEQNLEMRNEKLTRMHEIFISKINYEGGI